MATGGSETPLETGELVWSVPRRTLDLNTQKKNYTLDTYENTTPLPEEVQICQILDDCYGNQRSLAA